MDTKNNPETNDPGRGQRAQAPLRQSGREGARAHLHADAAGAFRGQGSWVSLGNPKPHEARRYAVEAVKAEADRHAANVLATIRAAQKAGENTLREITDALNARGVHTARGGKWFATSVKNILDRTQAD